MRLILVRHGQAERRGDEGDNLYLTEIGKRQVELLGDWLAHAEPGIDQIISSPLRRARETTSILNRYISAAVRVDDDLRETTTYLEEKLPRLVHPADSGPHYYMMPADNYYQRFAEQVRRVLNRILDNPASIQTKLVVCHGGTAATMVRLLFQCHHLNIAMNNTAMHYLTWTNGLWEVRGLNYAPHLPPELITA